MLHHLILIDAFLIYALILVSTLLIALRDTKGHPARMTFLFGLCMLGFYLQVLNYSLYGRLDYSPSWHQPQYAVDINVGGHQLLTLTGDTTFVGSAAKHIQIPVESQTITSPTGEQSTETQSKDLTLVTRANLTLKDGWLRGDVWYTTALKQEKPETSISLPAGATATSNQGVTYLPAGTSIKVRPQLVAPIIESREVLINQHVVGSSKFPMLIPDKDMLLTFTTYP